MFVCLATSPPEQPHARLSLSEADVDAQKAPSTPSADHDDAQGHDESDFHKGDHFGHFDVENLGVGWPVSAATCVCCGQSSKVQAGCVLISQVAFATQRPICALSSFCGGICGWVFLFVILLVSGKASAAGVIAAASNVVTCCVPGRCQRYAILH